MTYGEPAPFVPPDPPRSAYVVPPINGVTVAEVYRIMDLVHDSSGIGFEPWHFAYGRPVRHGVTPGGIEWRG